MGMGTPGHLLCSYSGHATHVHAVQIYHFLGCGALQLIWEVSDEESEGVGPLTSEADTAERHRVRQNTNRRSLGGLEISGRGTGGCQRSRARPEIAHENVRWKHVIRQVASDKPVTADGLVSNVCSGAVGGGSRGSL